MMKLLRRFWLWLFGPKPEPTGAPAPKGKQREAATVVFLFDYEPNPKVPVAWDGAALDAASPMFGKAEKALRVKAPKLFKGERPDIHMTVHGLPEAKAEAVFTVYGGSGACSN